MLVDEITLHLEAGKGGRGIAAFNKIRLSRGPTGGDGGRGASIYLEGVRDISALGVYSRHKEIRAKNGENGRGQFIDGKNAEDMVLRVPLGTSIEVLASGYRHEILEEGQRVLVAGGGVGGRGNFKFRSSTNTSPKEWEEGKEGDVVDLKLTLRLIADIGLVGLPNAGKSSLLNALTNAKAKIGSYAFTTLEPSLGSYYGLIIADIPGLIEGASQGKGLGVKFLKHIERTKQLFHLVAASAEDPLADYKTVRAELARFSPGLGEKPEKVFLSRADEVSQEHLRALEKRFQGEGIEVLPVSILDDASLASVRDILNDAMK